MGVEEHAGVVVEEEGEFYAKLGGIGVEFSLDPPDSAGDVGLEHAGAGHDCVAAGVIGLHLAEAVAAISINGISIVAGLIGTQERIPAQTHAVEIGIEVVSSGALARIRAVNLVVESRIAGSAVYGSSQVSRIGAALHRSADPAHQVPRCAITYIRASEGVARKAGTAVGGGYALETASYVVLAGVAEGDADVDVTGVAGTGIPAS